MFRWLRIIAITSNGKITGTRILRLNGTNWEDIGDRLSQRNDLSLPQLDEISGELSSETVEALFRHGQAEGRAR